MYIFTKNICDTDVYLLFLFVVLCVDYMNENPRKKCMCHVIIDLSLPFTNYHVTRPPNQEVIKTGVNCHVYTHRRYLFLLIIISIEFSLLQILFLFKPSPIALCTTTEI